MGEKELAITPEKLQNHRIAIATTTFYKDWTLSNIGSSLKIDQLRGNLAIETMKSAIEEGYQLVVVDGGSSEEFKKAIADLGIKIIDQKAKGMGASRREVLGEAMTLPGVEVICWTEPEKISMIENLLLAAKPILNPEADLVIPSRTKESYKTYPEQQAKSEQRANHLFSTVLRLTGLLPKDNPDLDIFFGPRIFRNAPEVTDLFTRQYKLRINSRLAKAVKPDNYLNTTFFPVMLALEKGLRVKSVFIDYHHPKVQTDFESDNIAMEIKRKDQKIDIVSGAIQLSRYFINNPKKPSDLIEF